MQRSSRPLAAEEHSRALWWRDSSANVSGLTCLCSVSSVAKSSAARSLSLNSGLVRYSLSASSFGTLCGALLTAYHLSASMHHRHMLVLATRSRISSTVSDVRRSFLSSLETFPYKLVNADGIRAQNTLNGPGTLPNCRRVYRYTIFTIKPFGLSIGARYEDMSVGSFR